ncbi:terminase small subunit [Sulfitobacter sp. D7]|jgi:DNA-binding transcriptional regulator YiaG|uniref:terminase small subunit n=1 Tax=Sulfitobacter sp. D7 TaxID=1968541 RepID=UPI000E778E88|nr:terminase small subunit [Sulfitobacter sp. D7]AYE86723.1 hypothetical protein B5M07_11710 [Sulfitobacter sp. D7]
MESNRNTPDGRQLGRPRKIANSELLLQQFVAYAQHVEESPFYIDKIFRTKNGFVRTKLRKSRPMTISGLCLYLGISTQAWQHWRRNRKDLQIAVEFISEAIFVHKYEGAAAGIFKANIISRELGSQDQF